MGGSAKLGSTQNDFFVMALTSTGVLDTVRFGNGLGYVTTDIGSTLTGNSAMFSADSTLGGLVVESNGKIVLSGTTTLNGATNSEFAVARYNSDGSLDTSFGTHGVAVASNGQKLSNYGAAVQSDGSIILTGIQIVTSPSASYTMVVTRFTNTGALDTANFGTGGWTYITFGTNFNFNLTGLGVRVLADNSILIGGSATNDGSTNTAKEDIALVKLTSNGGFDPNFGGVTWGPGRTLVDVSGGQDAEYNLIVQADGKIVVAGYGQFGSGTSNLNFEVLRFNSNGTLDTTFGTNGVEIIDFNGGDDGINGSIGLEPNGEIVVAGYVSVPNTGIAGTHRVWGLAELMSPGTPIQAGSAFTDTGSFTDAGPDGAYLATVDYGDGSGPQALALNGQSFALSHAYTYGGTYTITVSVTDNGGAVGTVTEEVTVLGPLAPTPSNPTPSNPTPSNPTPSNPTTTTAQPGLEVYASGPGSVT